MNAIIAVSIAVAGWIATHVLSLRAQRKNLRHQILDHARTEITEAIRDAQEWFSKLHATITSAEITAKLEAQGFPANWADIYQTVANFVHTLREANKWDLRLEEYLILFPECADVRIALQQRQRELQALVSKLASDLLSTVVDARNIDGRRKVLSDAKEWLGKVWDQSTLLEDLRIHLQNVTLSEITGNCVPVRKPPDPTVPRIVTGKAGALMIGYGESE